MKRMGRCMSSTWSMAVNGAALLAVFLAELHSSAELGTLLFSLFVLIMIETLTFSDCNVQRCMACIGGFKLVGFATKAGKVQTAYGSSGKMAHGLMMVLLTKMI